MSVLEPDSSAAPWAKASMILTALGIAPLLLTIPCKGMACVGGGVAIAIFLTVCCLLGLAAAIVSALRKEPRRRVRGAFMVTLAAVALIVLLNVF